MAELAIRTAGHVGDGASFHTVFIDTTLDTHLAMHVSSSDTVADLKKKIIEEHPACFPKCGAIRIDGLKVKRRGLYYHLAESMLVKSAFDGTKNSWFISVEASVIGCKGKEIEGIRNYEEEAKLALVDVDTNGLEDEGVGRVLDVPGVVVGDGGLLVTTRGEPSDSLDQNGSSGVDGLAVEVAEVGQLKGGDYGDEVMSIGLVVGSEARREEKSDGQAQDVEVEATETKIDDSMLQLGDLNHQFDGEAQGLEVQVTENRMDGGVLQGGDSNDNCDVKEKSKKRKRSEKGDDDVLMNELRTEGGEKETVVIGLAEREAGEVHENASAEGPEVQVGHGEPAKDESKKDDLVSERSDKPSMETSEHEPVAKKLKTGKEMENEGRTMVSESTEMNFEPSIVSQLPADVDGKIKKKKKSSKKLEKEINPLGEISRKQARSGNGNVVSELNDTTSEPPAVSQLPTGDDQQQLVNATVEGSDAEAKKKRKKKSSNKIDKEVTAVDEQSLKEAGGDNGYVVSEPTYMTCDPPAVSQLPIGDDQQLVNATVEGSDAEAKKKRKKKSSNKIDKEVTVVDEQSLKEAGGDNGYVVSEPTYMTCDPPTVSQLPTGDEQQLVNAATTLKASDADTKKKRKKKSSNKTDKEVNVDVEQSLKEAGDDHINVVEEPCHEPAIVQQEADEHMLQPSAVSLNDKDTDPVQEAHHTNFPSQDVNDFQKSVPGEMHRVATEKPAVSQTIASEVQKEVHSELPEAVPSLDISLLKKRKKSRKHKVLLSGTPVTSDLEFVKDAVIGNPIHEAADKGSVVLAKEGKEAVVAESVRASRLVTDDEINEVVKKVVDSVPQAMESKAVAEVKEPKSKKKPKRKRNSDAKISLLTQAEDENTGENIPVTPTVNVQDDTDLLNTRTGNSLAKASKVGNDAEEFSNNGVNFIAYFSPTEQDKKTSDHREATGAWVTTKGEKKRKAQDGDLDSVAPKLPEAPSLTGKRGSEANPHVDSSGKEKNQNKRKEVQQPNVASKPNGAVEHHSESFTNSTSKPKRSNKVQPLLQKGNVKQGRGSNANAGEVLNSTARPKPLSRSNSIFKRDLFGDASDDTLDSYVFPSRRQSHSSTPEPDSDVSSDSESDAGFDGKTGMKTPFSSGIPLGTILKSSIGFKKAKLDAESQPDDFIPMSPSTSK